MKNKKATINPVLDDNKCFQYTATVALNHEETRNHPQRISKIKSLPMKEIKRNKLPMTKR